MGMIPASYFCDRCAGPVKSSKELALVTFPDLTTPAEADCFGETSVQPSQVELCKGCAKGLARHISKFFEEENLYEKYIEGRY